MATLARKLTNTDQIVVSAYDRSVSLADNNALVHLGAQCEVLNETHFNALVIVKWVPAIRDRVLRQTSSPSSTVEFAGFAVAFGYPQSQFV